MNLNKKGRWKRLFVVSFLFWIMIAFCFICSCYSVEQSQNYVSLAEINEEKMLFFYKEDCQECRSIFPLIYARNLFYRDILFINLNEQNNKNVYKEKYDIVVVPTFIKNNKRYSGTDYKKIQVLFS